MTPLSNQDTADLVNGNQDLVSLFKDGSVSQVLAVAMDGNKNDVAFSTKSEDASLLSGLGIGYEGVLPVTPVIAQLKKGDDGFDRIDISVPKAQAQALMSRPDKASLTFRFKVSSKDSVILFNGRNLVAEGLASIEDDGAGGFVMVLVVSNVSGGLTFSDLTGTLFNVASKEDFFKSTLDKIHSKSYVYQDLVNLEIKNLDPNKWSEYKNAIDKQYSPTVEDIQRVIDNVNTGQTPSSGGGCSLGFAPASLLLLLPMMFLRR